MLKYEKKGLDQPLDQIKDFSCNTKKLEKEEKIKPKVVNLK